MNRAGTSSFVSFLRPGVDASRVYVRAWALGCFYSDISTRTFRKALTASVDSCAEIKVARFVTNEVVTNRAGIAPFFSHLNISTCDIVSVTCECVCVRVCVRACIKEREKEREKVRQRERDLID